MRSILIATNLLVFIGLTLCAEQNITASIYADNYFDFYVNGTLIKSDPLDFTPHNAVKFTFKVDTDYPRVYGVFAKDYASESGYEYTGTNKPQLGDGALRIVLSDGTVSSNKWKCFTTSFGPTNESIASGCSSDKLTLCKISSTTPPSNWSSFNFDDSSWSNAKEYTESEAGWGMKPSYSNGKCGTMTSPIDRSEKNPSSITTLSDECLDPQSISWGSSKFIWMSDLNRDNSIVCRIKSDAKSTTNTIPSSLRYIKVEAILFLLAIFLLLI